MNDNRPLDDQEPWVIGQHARRAREQKKAQRPLKASPEVIDNAIKAATDFLLELSPLYNDSAQFRALVESTYPRGEYTPDEMYVRDPKDSDTRNATIELVKGYQPLIDRLGTPACTLDTHTITKLKKLFKAFTDACERGLSSGGPAVGC